jgi:hypothetical protein
MATPERISSNIRTATTPDYRQISSTSTLIGDIVRNPQGEALGILKGIVSDEQSGRVTYFVLEGGGVVGTSGQLFAIPPSALTINPEDYALVLDIDRGVPKDAEGFQSDDLANVAQREGGRKLHSYAGLQALIRAQHLGANLVDSRSEEL